MSAFNVYDARREKQVIDETWGHLKAIPGRTYTGTIVFAHSEYSGETMPISVNIPDLEDSPWFYDQMFDLCQEHRTREREGKVFVWSGTYQTVHHPDVLDRDGNIERESWDQAVFTGEFREISLQ